MVLIRDEEAEALIDSMKLPKLREREVPVCEIQWLISAAEVTAPSDMPSRDIAAQDGYAISLVEGLKEYKIKEQAESLKPGEAKYVGTGWPLPAGANAVVRVEASRVEGDALTFSGEVKPWYDVERAGEDIRKGDAVLRRGELITPYHIATLVATGVERVRVFEICIGIISVGDEIVPCDSKNGVRDSLTPLLRGLMPFAHVEVAHTPDDKGRIVSAINEMVSSCDMVVTIGGSSVGSRDFTKEAIREAGDLVFEGVQTNVVKRGGVGLVNGKPVLSLPGRPVSAVAVFHVHGLHILSRMAGVELRKYVEVELAEDLQVMHKMNSTYLFRLDGSRAYPLRWGTGLYSQLILADALARLQRGRLYMKGEMIRAQLLFGKRV